MLSQWGWWCFLGKYSKANLYFLPSLTACLQITLLVCMGLANQLLPGAYFLSALGVVLLIVFLIRGHNPLKYLSFLEVIFLLFMMVLVFHATKGKVLFHHDDFSHWGTVLKELLRVDHFSTGKPFLSEHLTYPLGCSLWIYSFIKMIGTESESLFTFAQTLMMLYCILPLFSFLPKKSCRMFSFLFLLFIFLLTNCLLNYDIIILSLQVDTELPLIGAAATLFAFYAGESFGCPLDDNPEKRSIQAWFLIPYLSGIILIKSSGAFFTIPSIAVLFLKSSAWKSKRTLFHTGVIFILSFVPYILWRIYCSRNYSGLTIAHEGSVSSFIRVVSQKSPEELSMIFHNAVSHFLSSHCLIEFMVVFAVVFVIAILISDDSHFYQVAKVWGFLFVTYLLYALGTIGMYFFSMPRHTAVGLASIDRYQKTMLIYCYYLLVCTLFFSMSHINFVLIRNDRHTPNGQKNQHETSASHARRYQFVRTNEQNRTEAHIQVSRILILLCVTILLSSGWYFRNHNRFYTIFDGYRGVYLYPRINCEAALKEAGVPERAKCIVLTTEQRRVYKALLAFLLGADWNDTKQITITSPDQLAEVDDALAGEYWVLVVDQENEIIQTWLSQRENPHIVIVPYDTK